MHFWDLCVSDSTTLFCDTYYEFWRAIIISMPTQKVLIQKLITVIKQCNKEFLMKKKKKTLRTWENTCKYPFPALHGAIFSALGCISIYSLFLVYTVGCYNMYIKHYNVSDLRPLFSPQKQKIF